MALDQYKQDFEDFGEVIWLNAASEGPLPKVAAQALHEAIHWKSVVHLLDIPKFIKVPLDLKQSIAKLINVDHRDVILGTSASYGLHILANGIKWEAGDEIVLMQNDFPTNIVPWLGLKNKGVEIKQIKARHHIVSPEELKPHLTSRTRLVCLSHVHTFSGFKLDVASVAQMCQTQGVKFVLNIAQSLGTMPVSVSDLGVDAVVAVGYKWLCGPYGTGFCWIKEDFRDELDYNRAYWSSYLDEEELTKDEPIAFKEQHSARKYDIFGTANFFNYVPLTAAINYWLKVGIDNVRRHNQTLIDKLIDGIDQAKYQLISPQTEENRSNLFVFSHRLKAKNPEIVATLKDNRIYSAFWKGNVRLAPHIYNDDSDIKRALDVLNSFT